MRKLIFISSIIVLLCISLPMFAKQEPHHSSHLTSDLSMQVSKELKPELPDYKKAPFVKDGAGTESTILHEEWGELPGDFYNDKEYALGNKKNVGNMVGIFYNPDKSFKYAEWIELKLEDGKPVGAVIRSYLYKDGKFVFEQEKGLILK